MDRDGDDLLSASIADPGPEGSLHSHLDGSGVNRIGRGSQPQKVLDSEQILRQLPERVGLVALLGAMP